ncbi:MAG: hypothetical protein KGI27_15700, partial [Thaumarchaeota archaeon]|nr:hypothetical protein [Nitrososphaerota archaeon]
MLDIAKCKSCGHDLKEHYHLKSDGYGCVGNGENCACISFTAYGHVNKNILTLDDMWEFIDSILIPLGLMPEKANLTEEQVIKLYDELVAADMQFKELEQIAV